MNNALREGLLLSCAMRVNMFMLKVVQLLCGGHMKRFLRDATRLFFLLWSASSFLCAASMQNKPYCLARRSDKNTPVLLTMGQKDYLIKKGYALSLARRDAVTSVFNADEALSERIDVGYSLEEKDYASLHTYLAHYVNEHIAYDFTVDEMEACLLHCSCGDVSWNTKIYVIPQFKEEIDNLFALKKGKDGDLMLYLQCMEDVYEQHRVYTDGKLGIAKRKDAVNSCSIL